MSSPSRSTTSSRGRRPSLSSSSTSIAVLSRNSSFANSSTSINSSNNHHQVLSEHILQQHNNLNYTNSSEIGQVRKVSRRLSYTREQENQVVQSSLLHRSSDILENQEEVQRLKVEKMFQSAIKKSSKTSSPQKPISRRIYATDKYELSDTEYSSEISSISTGLSSIESPHESQSVLNEDASSTKPIRKLVYNMEDSIDSNQDEEDLQILIPRTTLKTCSRNSSQLVDSVQNIDITPIPEDDEEDYDVYSMIEANRMLKNALDGVTKEKNNLEEQFVTQVEELEKFLTRSQRPQVKKGVRRSLSKHLSDEEMSNVNSALRTGIPNAEDSPIVKLSQSLLNNTMKRLPEPTMTSSEADSIIYSLREKIEEIKYRYENERATESVKEALTTEISSLLEKLTDTDGSQTERTRNLTSSLQSFLDSSSLSVMNAPRQNESKLVKELKIKLEIQTEIIDKLKAENQNLKDKVESERKNRKIISKELSQSESYIIRLEEQMQKREMHSNEKIEIVTRAYDDIVSENFELIQQVKFLREQLQEYQNNTNISFVSGSSKSNMNNKFPNKLTSNNIISMISDTQSVCSRNDEPVKDINSKY